MTFFWTVPDKISKYPEIWKKVYIYESESETAGFVKIDEINAMSNNFWVTSYTSDRLTPESRFYIIKYASEDGLQISETILVYFELNPKELRLVTSIRNAFDPILLKRIEDHHLRNGLYFSLHSFNWHMPITDFHLEDFPVAFEPLLVLGGEIFTFTDVYLRNAIKDISLTDGGLAITLDRGGKLKTAVDEVTGLYDKYLKFAKLDYMPDGVGLGSIPLPVSLGGVISRNLMSIFDIFKTVAY